MKSTIYITKFEEHLLKSWIPPNTQQWIDWQGNDHFQNRRIVVEEQILSDILYFLDRADMNYNGEKKDFINKLTEAGKNVFSW